MDPCPALPPVEAFLSWAADVARGVAAAWRLVPGSQEDDDLAQVAALAVCELYPRYRDERRPAGGDPDGLFRGWAHRSVLTACHREAERLRNAGTYHTRRGPAGPAVPYLADLTTPAGDRYDLPAPPAAHPADPDGLYDLTDDTRPRPWEHDPMTPTATPAAVPELDARIAALRAEAEALEQARPVLAQLAGLVRTAPLLRAVVLAEFADPPKAAGKPKARPKPAAAAA